MVKIEEKDGSPGSSVDQGATRSENNCSPNTKSFSVRFSKTCYILFLRWGVDFGFCMKKIRKFIKQSCILNKSFENYLGRYLGHFEKLLYSDIFKICIFKLLFCALVSHVPHKKQKIGNIYLGYKENFLKGVYCDEIHNYL